MGRVTVFADIAGRVARDTKGNERVSIGAVAIETARINAAFAQIAPALPKWRNATSESLSAILDLLQTHADAIAVLTVDKTVPQWEQFWDDAAYVNTWMASHLKGPTGFTKAANVIKFWLFGLGVTSATATATRLRRLTTLLDPHGRERVQQSVVCDGDIEGVENIRAFHRLWETRNKQQPLTHSLGMHIVTDSLTLASEQSSPLLNLADYAAGIVHATLSPTPTMGAGVIFTQPTQVGLRTNERHANLCYPRSPVRYFL
jgi:hypothetical protein